MIASEDHCDDMQMQQSRHFQISLNEVDDMGTKDFERPTSLAREYFESTTTHGLSHICSAKNACTRSLWLIIFLVVFGLLVASICALIAKATRHSAITYIKTELHDALELPAITFCNGKPFRELGLSKALPKGFAMNHLKSPKNTKMKLAIGLSNLTDTDLKEIGHSMNIFLMKEMSSCFFRDKMCDFADFKTTTTPVYGNCFTFNAKDSKQKKVCSGSGLFTLLNINQDENIPGVMPLTSTASVKVMLHHPNEIFSETQAIYLAPGTWTDIKIQKKIIKRLPDPYPSNCSQKATMEEFFGVPVRYTTAMCELMCYVNEQNKTCGYTSPLFSSYVKSALPQFAPEDKGTSMKYKIAEHESQIKCLLHFDDMYEKEKVQCNCQQPCYEEQFKIVTSNAVWPPLNRAQELLSNMKNAYNEMIFNNWNTDTLYNNILAINLYFNDFAIETVEQQPVYTWGDFTSDLGGQMGLWIGASVFSAFELGTFLFRWLTSLLLSRQQRKVHV